MLTEIGWTFKNVLQRQHDSFLPSYVAVARLKHILKMITPDCRSANSLILDVGCGGGLFTHVLSQHSIAVGVDIRRKFIKRLQNSNTRPEFVVADINRLPFRRDVFDIIICASVLEHLIYLDACLLNLCELLKKNGSLIAAYPVETLLFKSIWRIVSPREFRFIDQTQTFFVNPYTHETECYWTNPTTHKQTYRNIRKLVKKSFKVSRRISFPLNSSPDFITFYECLKLAKC